MALLDVSREGVEPLHPAATFNVNQPPPEQVRILLLVKRRQGVDFDLAWGFAMRCVRWPHDTTHRAEWKDAMEWSREAWRSAYLLLKDDPLDGVVTALRAA